ncbi:hypothetical protein VPH35_068607 [Triticum aestivum]|uniref:Uncharacterized protein n=1 Tax=Triticum aestivum TaxID=4565 RepID=A0A3B6HZD0_WHEAT
MGEGKVAEEKGGPPGLLDVPGGVLFEVKKEAVMLLGGGLGGEPAPVLGVGNFVAEGDSLEAAIDAEMCTVAPVDAEMSPNHFGIIFRANCATIVIPRGATFPSI